MVPNHNIVSPQNGDTRSEPSPPPPPPSDATVLLIYEFDSTTFWVLDKHVSDDTRLIIFLLKFFSVAAKK